MNLMQLKGCGAGAADPGTPGGSPADAVFRCGFAFSGGVSWKRLQLCELRDSGATAPLSFGGLQ